MNSQRTIGAVSSLVVALAVTMMMPTATLAADAVKIGYSNPRTGFLAEGALQEERAHVLWMEQVNERGGLDIGGTERRLIEFVVYDDQSDASRTPAIYEKLILDDKVDLLLTPYATPLHLAIIPTIERYKFPLVGNSAISVKLRDIGSAYMFFAAPAPDNYAEQIAGFLKASGVDTVSMMTLELPMSLEMRSFTVPLLKQAGIEIISDQRYPPAIKDMTSMLIAIMSDKPDAVLAYTYPGDSELYMRQSRELGIDVPIQFLMLGINYPFLIERHGEHINGMIGIGQWDPYNGRAGSVEFFETYVKRWNEIPDYATSAIAWVSLEILEQAVAAVGLDKEKLRDHLASATFETIMGSVKFNGQMGSVSAGLFQLQGDEAHVIWPPEIASSKFQPR